MDAASAIINCIMNVTLTYIYAYLSMWAVKDNLHYT